MIYSVNVQSSDLSGRGSFLCQNGLNLINQVWIGFYNTMGTSGYSTHPGESTYTSSTHSDIKDFLGKCKNYLLILFTAFQCVKIVIIIKLIRGVENS